jgi:hypothetical protein
MTEDEKQTIYEMAGINKMPTIRTKAIEELSELIRAIARGDVENILEETVDTEIMILQLLWSLPEGSRTRRAELFSEKVDYIRGLIAVHKVEKLNKETVRMPMLNHEHGDDAEVNG